ncbi:DUF5711 family protein [Tissierella carlieri]|uniref:DUF5711 family protein n=1 Tax=Tissierella carlieri TaxID=689904 RepID=A0ABT1S880_9FIRM|nr:DUF5711 family protein [Tissierella carlieri]MCQ4922676.1 DUF5711 family protein [Tissierella carlieri]
MEENKKSSLKGFKIFIMVFLILSIFLLREENQKRLAKILDFIGGKEKVLKLVNSFENEDDIQNINIYNETVVKYNNNKISFMETDGTLIMEKEFNFEDPFVHYGDKHIYVMDKSTGDIYSFDKDGKTIDKLQFGEEIFNLKESHQNLIYHIKNSDVESIKILDKDRVVFGNYSYEDKNILTCVSNINGTRAAISLLNLNEGILKSQIEYYGENKEKLGSLDIEGEIVVYLNFTSKNEIIALSDRSLYFIKDDKIMWKKEFDLMKDIYLGKDKIYILYSNYLETIDFNGNTEEKIGFTEDYKKILPFEQRFLLYGDDNIAIVEGKKEILKHNDNIIEVFTSKDQILIWGPEEIKTYRISNKK